LHSLSENRKYRARSRIFFDLRAPEKLRSGRQPLIYARFSPSRIEPVPFAAPGDVVGEKERGVKSQVL
jgi:hypothetical protein